MSKIRILVAHNNKTIINKISDTIKNLDYVELIGTATEGKETYNKIIDLKPEIVFTKIDLENMDSMEIIKKSKENLDEKIPVFNIITNNNVSDTYIEEAYSIIGRKMNTFIKEPINNIEIDNIMKNYKEYKESQ